MVPKLSPRLPICVLNRVFMAITMRNGAVEAGSRTTTVSTCISILIRLILQFSKRLLVLEHSNCNTVRFLAVETGLVRLINPLWVISILPGVLALPRIILHQVDANGRTCVAPIRLQRRLPAQHPCHREALAKVSLSTADLTNGGSDLKVSLALPV